MQSRRINLRLAGSIAAAGVILVAIFLFALAQCPLAAICGSVSATDISQGRLDTALPAPQGDFAIEQTFSPIHDGLSAVELILVHYGGEQPDGRLTLDLIDDDGQIVATETLLSGKVSHNQTYLFEFPAQAHSAGRPFRLRLTGDKANQVAAWGYSLDVVQPGDLQIMPLGDSALAPESAARELRFTGKYDLTVMGALDYLARTISQYAGLLLLTLAFLLMPGCLLLMAGGPQRWDSAASVGTALALGMAAWPLAWLWLTLIGGRWSGPLLWAVLIGGWVTVAVLWWLRSRSNTDSPGVRISTALRRADWWTYGLLIALLITSVAVRLLAVRDLAFPPWVDSSRHGLITAVMVAKGQAPSDYNPYLPVDRFPYHYGFHSISASLSLMTGLPLAGLLLVLGQLLNGLLPLTVYSAGWMVSRQRAVGLLAAFLVALPFLFPGYYATWGRMTQLSAMLVLPVLLAVTWRLGRGWPGTWVLAAVLGGGLFLLHFRVFLFFLPFALLVLLIQVVSYRRFRPYAQAALLGLVLIGPRAYQLWRETNPVQALQNSVAGFNAFPAGYLTAGWERSFIVLAALALGVVLVGVWRGERWAVFPLVLVAWVASLFLLLAGERLGLPETLVVNLNSMYISLFLPLSLFLSLVTARLWHWGMKLLGHRTPAPGLKLAAAILLGMTVGVLTLFGIRAQAGMINPQTILAEPQDLEALAWIDATLPGDVKVAVNSWRWLGNTWAAADGGAWLVPLTGRSATTPPIDHIYSPTLFAEVREFNEQASSFKDWSDTAAVAWLRKQGVTHIFVGARGGFLDPAALMRNPLLRPIYQSGGTFVFLVQSS